MSFTTDFIHKAEFARDFSRIIRGNSEESKEIQRMLERKLGRGTVEMFNEWARDMMGLNRQNLNILDMSTEFWPISVVILQRPAVVSTSQ